MQRRSAGLRPTEWRLQSDLRSMASAVTVPTEVAVRENWASPEFRRVSLKSSRLPRTTGRGEHTLATLDEWDWFFLSTGLISVGGLCLALLLSVVVLRSLGRRWRRQYNPTVCRICGYMLIGLTNRRCPECGTKFEAVPSLKGSESQVTSRRLTSEASDDKQAI